MSDDSSDNNGLFDEEDNDSQIEEFKQLEPPPEYTNTDEFKTFVQQQDIQLTANGYMYVHTYKPFYFPGEIVRGSVLIDIFNPLPKDSKTIYLRFSGREHVGRHYSVVKDSLFKQKQRQ